LLETERTKERKKQTKEETNKETTALLLHISVITLSNKIKLFSNINELSVREERTG
jgi:phosphoribosyl-ATP pyrophosphohydrolase